MQVSLDGFVIVNYFLKACQTSFGRTLQNTVTEF